MNNIVINILPFVLTFMGLAVSLITAIMTFMLKKRSQRVKKLKRKEATHDNKRSINNIIIRWDFNVNNAKPVIKEIPLQQNIDFGKARWFFVGKSGVSSSNTKKIYKCSFKNNDYLNNDIFTKIDLNLKKKFIDAIKENKTKKVRTRSEYKYLFFKAKNTDVKKILQSIESVNNLYSEKVTNSKSLLNSIPTFDFVSANEYVIFRIKDTDFENMINMLQLINDFSDKDDFLITSRRIQPRINCEKKDTSYTNKKHNRVQ